MTDSQINFLICEITGDDPHRKGAKDYCNDLNAMHEAEKVLTQGTIKQIIHATNAYILHLARILQCDETAHFKFIHATARQRAEAFLRTLRKWEEAK